MSILSKSCVYGLRAILYVASFHAGRRYVPIREVSDKLDISFHFLTKILQQLTDAGLLVSYRGPKGGVGLGKPAGEIRLMDVVIAVDGRSEFDNCFLGLSECGDKHPCPLHHLWGEYRENLAKELESTSLEDLSGPVRKELVLLSDLQRGRKRGKR